MERHFGYTLPPVGAQGLPHRSGGTFTLETNPNACGHSSTGNVAVHPSCNLQVLVRLRVCLTLPLRICRVYLRPKCNKSGTGLPGGELLETIETRCLPGRFRYRGHPAEKSGHQGQSEGVLSSCVLWSRRWQNGCQFCKPLEVAPLRQLPGKVCWFFIFSGPRLARNPYRGDNSGWPGRGHTRTLAKTVS